MTMDTESGPPLPPSEAGQKIESHPELKPKPQEELADRSPVDESNKIAETREKITELSEEKEDVVPTAPRKTSIVGDNPYPGMPPVRAEETDDIPIVAGQNFSKEEFGRNYFYGRSLNSNYGIVKRGYKLYDNDRFWNPVVKMLKRHLPANATRVLDVGCAAGYLVKRLKQAGFEETVGADISTDILEEAKGNVPQARFEEVNLSTDTFNPALSGTFDAITAMDVIEHTAGRIGPDGKMISGPAHVIPKLAALLKKDGVFVMSVPTTDKNLVNWVFNLFDSDKSHVSKLPSKEFLEILKVNNLEVLEKRYMFLLPWVRIPHLHTALEVVCKKK